MKLMRLRRFLARKWNSLSETRVVNVLREGLLPEKKVSFSSYGEDLLIESIVSRYKFKTGHNLTLSYLDIGAWRPKIGSNTYKLYTQGSRGTVVEPNPSLQFLWRVFRPKDQYLKIACSNKNTVDLYMFGKTAPSNTINMAFSRKIEFNQNRKVRYILKTEAKPLMEIVEVHQSRFVGDFLLDLDIEGSDLEILLDYDFTCNPRPVIILIEDIQTSDNYDIPSKIHTYLTKSEYLLVGKSVVTSIYIDLNHSISTIGFY